MRHFLPLFSAVIALAVLVGGCATTSTSSSTATHGAPAGSDAVLGIWEYRTQGSAYLDEGVLRITVEDGRLAGDLKDSRIGHASVRVELRDSQIEMRVDDVHVDGRVEDDRFVGFVRRPMWDVSTSQNVADTFRASNPYRNRASDRSVAIVARRVRDLSYRGTGVPLGCTGGPTETDYTCSDS